MHTCSAYQHRTPYASSGSPLRGYHSLPRHDDNVFPTYSAVRGLTPRCRRLSAAAADCRLRSSGSDGRKSPSFASGSPDGASHMDCSLEYLADLVKEKKDLEMFVDNFQHVERLLNEEISRVRGALFQTEFVTEPFDLPEPIGDVVTITEKIYVPKREYPDYNFVGRILGPRGMTAKQLEQETGCKIMVRGKGSMRDKRKEEANRGKPNWEHLDDELHVLLQCEDTENRARIKLRAAMDHVKKLLVPAPEGTDELKRKQLMELAIINGTYRPFHKSGLSNSNRIITPVPLVSPIRAPIFVSPTSSPNNGMVQKPSNPGYIGTNSQQPFDYSSFMNSNFLESALASFQIANELHLPTFPTATSLVNSFPSLFMNTSANSVTTQDTSTSATALSPTKCF
ncbi:KH domain protein [Cooperia oncophora]